MKSSLIQVQIVYDRRRVSFRAEPELVEAIDCVCASERITRAEMVMRAEAAQSHGTLTSAIRTYVLTWLLNHVELDNSACAASPPAPAVTGYPDHRVELMLDK
jgi:predicted DNA-binding ribbon-helix-helix protein